LSTATVPLSKSPCYYDQNTVDALQAAGNPFAELTPGHEPQYTHVPPRDPGLAIPLRIGRFVGPPVSVISLITEQLVVDAIMFPILGFLCFRIDGIVGAVIGLGAYACSPEVAGAPARFLTLE